MTKGKGLTQEGLKLLACVAMFLDHFAAVMVSDYKLMILLRGIGRLAFPIYCFLLAEGVHYTKNPKKYALRLALAALLAEIPFDYALFGGFTWAHQSVMVTLLLGFGALQCVRAEEKPLVKLLLALPFVLAGEVLHVDYGGHGVALVVLLGVVRDLPGAPWLRAAVVVLISVLLGGMKIRVFGVTLPLEWLAVFSLIPIHFYRGAKSSHSKALQWAFSLFYPVHLALLWLLRA